jgi:hypothetical protein
VNQPTLKFFQKISMHYVAFDYHYLLTKSTDILFQQVCGYVLFSTIFSFHFQTWMLLVTLALLGAISHTYLMRRHLGIGIYFTIAGGLAGIVFPLVAVYSNNAFVYTYAIHWSFYVVTGVAANLIMKNTTIRIQKK